MVRASRLKFLAILLIASHVKAGSIPSDEALSSADHDSSSSSMHGFGGSADTVLKTDAFHFSHSSDFGAGSTSDHFASRADHEPVQIVVDDLVRNSCKLALLFFIPRKTRLTQKCLEGRRNFAKNLASLITTLI